MRHYSSMFAKRTTRRWKSRLLPAAWRQLRARIEPLAAGSFPGRPRGGRIRSESAADSSRAKTVEGGAGEGAGGQGPWGAGDWSPALMFLQPWRSQGRVRSRADYQYIDNSQVMAYQTLSGSPRRRVISGRVRGRRRRDRGPGGGR